MFGDIYQVWMIRSWFSLVSHYSAHHEPIHIEPPNSDHSSETSSYFFQHQIQIWECLLLNLSKSYYTLRFVLRFCLLPETSPENLTFFAFFLHGLQKHLKILHTNFVYVFIHTILSSVQSLSHVRLFATPWTAAHQVSLSITNSQSPPKPMSIESGMPSNHLILCRPLLLLPSIFPSIRVFSNESALRIRWPKYWISASANTVEELKNEETRYQKDWSLSWNVPGLWSWKRSDIQWSFWLKDLRGKERPAEGIRWLQGV